jgi:DNA-binding LytR/AlgR family response regulator
MKRLIIIDDHGHEKLVESFLEQLRNSVDFDSSKGRGVATDIAKFLPGLPDGGTQRKIQLEDEKLMHRLNTEDVILAEAVEGGCRIRLKKGEAVIIKKSLSSVEACLRSPYFLKVNPSQIINLLHLTEISFGQNPEAVVSDGTRVAFSEDAAIILSEYFKQNSQ